MLLPARGGDGLEAGSRIIGRQVGDLCLTTVALGPPEHLRAETARSRCIESAVCALLPVMR
jgi:hypothetical protein